MRSVRILPRDNFWILDGVDEDVVFEGGGTVIAHDLLEHQQGIHMIGDPWDEMIALGAYMFVRGNLNDYRGLATDILHSFEEAPLDSKILNANPCDADWAFEESINKAIKSIDKPVPPIFYDAVLSYMRRGWHLAERRFEDELIAYDLFYRIVYAVDEAEKGVPHTLSYSIKSCKVYCKPNYGEWK